MWVNFEKIIQRIAFQGKIAMNIVKFILKILRALSAIHPISLQNNNSEEWLEGATALENRRQI
jgi:hypothetical protein